MTNILLIKLNGMYSLSCERNRGGAGIAIATIQTLRQSIPDADFVSLVQFSEEFAQEHGIRVVRNKILTKKNHSLGTMMKSSFNLVRCALWAIFRKPFPRISKTLLSGKELKAYADADVIIDISMDLYNDNYIGALPVIEHTKAILMGILLKKPVVIWAQSPGPFKSRLIGWLVKFTMNRVALIIVREEISLANIDKLGVTKPPIHLNADPAFLLEPAPEERGQEIIVNEGFSKNSRPLIGLAMGWTNIDWRVGAKWYRRYLGPIYRLLVFLLPEGLYKIRKKRSARPVMPNISDYSKLDETAKIIDYLVTKLTANVILVPHDYTASGDERILHDTILKRVKHRDNAIGLTGDYTAPELKAVIGQCDLFVGGKMHANIAATSMYVPTVAIQYKQYSQKFNGIMRLLGQEKYVCSKLSLDEVKIKVAGAWAERQVIKAELKKNIAIIREKAQYNAVLVKDLLNSRERMPRDKISLEDGAKDMLLPRRLLLNSNTNSTKI